MQQQILHWLWDLPSLPRSSCASPCTPPFCRDPTAITGHSCTALLPHRPARAHLVPLPPNLTPQAHGHGAMLTNINWITETEEQNWNSIRSTWNRKFLSNKHGKLEKKSTLVLDKGCHCKQGRKLQPPSRCCQLRTLDSWPSGQERQTHRKRFFHNAPLVCQIRRRCQK